MLVSFVKNANNNPKIQNTINNIYIFLKIYDILNLYICAVTDVEKEKWEQTVMFIGRREENRTKAFAYNHNTYTDGITIRPVYRDEWDDAMSLAWRTFMRFDAVDYTKEGIESFQNFITDNILHKMFVMGSYQMFGAYDNKRIVGMISLRNETQISLLFVDAAYHKRGIGKALIEYLSDYVLKEEGFNRIKVNAAPYALGFYHKLGFYDLDVQKTSDGISYTPMERRLTPQNRK